MGIQLCQIYTDQLPWKERNFTKFLHSSKVGKVNAEILSVCKIHHREIIEIEVPILLLNSKKQNLQKLYEEVKEGATNEELTGLLRQANATVFA